MSNFHGINRLSSTATADAGLDKGCLWWLRCITLISKVIAQSALLSRGPRAYCGCGMKDAARLTTATTVIMARAGMNNLLLCRFLPTVWLGDSRSAISSCKCGRGSKEKESALPLCNHTDTPLLCSDNYWCGLLCTAGLHDLNSRTSRRVLVMQNALELHML